MTTENPQPTNEAAGGASAVERVVRPRAGLFLCSRTSEWGRKPCDEAFQVTVGGHDKWAVDLPDVCAFVDKYGYCIIGGTSDGLYTIEIYDDYRE